MVRRLILFLSAILLVAAIVVFTAGHWLLYTPQGARWFLETAAQGAGAELEIDQVEGRLADELRLHGIRLRRKGSEATLDRLRLQWRPGRLLYGELAVSELSMEEGNLSAAPAPSAEEKEPAEFGWPRLSGLALRLEALIEELHLENIAWHPSEGALRRLDTLTARLAWEEGTLKVSGLDAEGEGYRLWGDASAGFVNPLLRLDLRLDLPEPVAEMEGLRLTADLEEGEEALLSGPVELRGGRGQTTVLDLNALIAWTEDALRLRRFELSHVSLGGTLRGEGEIALMEPFAFSLRAEVQGIDLAKTTGVAAEIGGRVEVSGTLEDYGGRFDLSSRGASWRRGRLAGRFSGNTEQVSFSDVDGNWLRGVLRGEAAIGWREGIRAEARLQGRGLNPAVLEPRWFGKVNLDVEGSLAKRPEEALRADAKGELLDSTLRGLPLTGRADLSVRGEDLRIAAIELHGDGFDLAAHGRLRERLEVSADVRRLGGLVPGAAGSLKGVGWLRWRGGEASGSLRLRGERLALAGARAAALRGEAALTEGRPWTIRLHAGGLAYDRLLLDALELAVDGTPQRHEIRLHAGGPEGRGEMLAEGGWRGTFWSGRLERLRGETRDFGDWSLEGPVRVQLGARKLRIASLSLKGSGGMTLRLSSDLAGSPLRGTLDGAWRRIDLTLLGPWLPETMELEGESSGEADLRLLGEKRTAVAGRIEAAGQLTLGEFSAAFSRVEGTVDWDDGGLVARLEMEMEGGGRLAAELSAGEPPPALPRRGRVAARWEGVDLALLRPWILADLRLRGELNGETKGEWMPGHRLSLSGRAGIGSGQVAWRQGRGEVAFRVRTAEASWRWEGEAFQGRIALALAEVGRVEGSFSLPLPARIPSAPMPQGPLSIRFSGEMREQGLLSAIFPGLLRESQGDIAAELGIGGTWRSPDPGGWLKLSGAGAYLPAAGIEIENVEARAELSGQSLRLVSFSAGSGPGRIEGEGDVRFEKWRATRYRATLKGKRFQLVNLPELQLLVSPDLDLSGTTERLKVRGEVDLPELILAQRKKAEMVEESADVVVVGAETPAEKKELPIALDLGVKVVLGKRVLIKLAGVDARLAGELDLKAEGVEDITAQGEIRVVEGIYSAYGVRLKIDRGRILYAGGPVDRPTLDILALRTVGEVKAGVQVGGTPRQPVVSLYSEPAMPETDVLSYIVLGHPLGGDRQSAGLLMGAAGALLSRGESAVLQDRLKRRLGVDVLTIESGGGEVESSVVTIGKYLSPRLYISYGRSIFTGGSEAKLRYELGRRWELESKMGEESGVDLFYKIEFK